MQSHIFHQPKQKPKAGRAYVIPYDGDKALIGIKQVIYYPQQEELEECKFNSKKPNVSTQKWEILKSRISSHQYNACFEGGIEEEFELPRCNNLFLPAGGKPTCFGGGIDKGETPQVAAARELLEETGILQTLFDSYKQKEVQQYYDSLMNEIIMNLRFIEEATDFDGVYYALDINKCPHLQQYLSSDEIEKENQSLMNTEHACQTMTLQKRKDHDLKTLASEMHQLMWVPLSSLDQELDKSIDDPNLQSYVNKEISRGIELLLKHLELNSNKLLYDSYKSLLTLAIHNGLANQPTAANVHAAKTLKAALGVNYKLTR